MSEDQLAAYQQMLKDEAANFGISWGKSEAAYIDRHSKLSSDQKTEVAKVIAELPDDEGGPTSLALGASNPGAQQKLEARIRALENVLTQEQLEKYRQARMREIEQSSAMMRALGIGESSGR